MHWGQRDLKVALGPELHVRGRILGPLDSIMGPEGKPAVSYDQHHGGTVRDLSEQDEAPVEVRDGVGHFEIQGLWQGPLTIYAGYKDTRLRLTKPVDDLVIDLRGEAQGGRPGATRDVRLRLAPPPGEPTPTGSLWIACNSEPDSHKHGQSVEHEIVDGEVRLSSPAPAVLTLTSGAMLGFVPKEEMMGIRVTTGAEPLVVKVPVLPAGAVVGRLLDAEDQAVGHSSVIVLPTEKSWQASVPMPMRYESTDARGRFALPDVPLGAEFRLLASVDWSFVSKGPLGVDAAHPVAEVDIRLPAGVDLRVG